MRTSLLIPAVISWLAYVVSSVAHSPKTLVIGFDEFRYDVPNTFNLSSFANIAQNGVRAIIGMKPVFPTTITSNYWSMNTGLYSNHHCMTGDMFYDEQFKGYYSAYSEKEILDPKWFKGDAIWTGVQRLGKRVVANNWPYSWIHSRGKPGPQLVVREVNAPHIFFNYTSPSVIENRINWALKHLKEDGTDLVLIYFNEPSYSSQNFGVFSEQARTVSKMLDSKLNHLLQALEAPPLKNNVNLVLVADHGVLDISKSSKSIIVLSKYVNLKDIEWFVPNYPNYPSAYCALKARPGRRQAVYDGLMKMPSVSLIKVDDLPVEERDVTRCPGQNGDVIIVCDAGYIVQGEDATPPSAVTSGGYDETLYAMRGIFYAKGPNVRKNVQIDDIESVDIYGLLSKLLGVAVDMKDGSLDGVNRVLLN